MKKIFSSFVAACLIVGGSVGSCQCSETNYSRLAWNAVIVAGGAIAVPLGLSAAVTKFIVPPITFSEITSSEHPFTLQHLTFAIPMLTYVLCKTSIIDNEFVSQRFDADDCERLTNLALVMALGGWLLGMS
jgi:hypothetical protein